MSVKKPLSMISKDQGRRLRVEPNVIDIADNFTNGNPISIHIAKTFSFDNKIDFSKTKYDPQRIALEQSMIASNQNSIFAPSVIGGAVNRPKLLNILPGSHKVSIIHDPLEMT